MDLKDFSKWTKKTAINVEQNSDKLVRTCALAVDATVVLATPVDTGRARSNWQVNLNDAAKGTIPPHVPGKGLGIGEGANAREAIAQGSKTIAQYKGGSVAAEIHITNNLSYIGRLNNGWSGQAPAGFVEKAVNVGADAIRGESVIANRSSTIQ